MDRRAAVSRWVVIGGVAALLVAGFVAWRLFAKPSAGQKDQMIVAAVEQYMRAYLHLGVTVAVHPEIQPGNPLVTSEFVSDYIADAMPKVERQVLKDGLAEMIENSNSLRPIKARYPSAEIRASYMSGLTTGIDEGDVLFVRVMEPQPINRGRVLVYLQIYATTNLQESAIILLERRGGEWKMTDHVPFNDLGNLHSHTAPH